MDRNLVAPLSERGGQRGDMDVLPARVDTSHVGERAGVLRYQGEPHKTFSFKAARWPTVSAT
jgi:hypothetical protein